MKFLILAALAVAVDVAVVHGHYVHPQCYFKNCPVGKWLPGVPEANCTACPSGVGSGHCPSCPTCEAIKDAGTCLARPSPTGACPAAAVGGEGGKGGALDGTPTSCVWNDTPATPGCSSCTAERGMALALQWCESIGCAKAGINNTAVLRGCSYKDVNCLTSQKCPSNGHCNGERGSTQGQKCTPGPTGCPGGYEWRCYRKDALNKNGTAWVPGKGAAPKQSYCTKGVLGRILQTCNTTYATTSTDNQESCNPK